jgi:thioredoxin-related protein
MMRKLKFLSALAMGLTLLSFTIWQSDFETARKLAKEKDALILLNFSGSDWCGPCIRMKTEIFASDAFTAMADTCLVLLNADFPRSKKNQLSKNQQAQNNLLADRYNPNGKFPFTLLLDQEGNVLQSWEGLPAMNATEFTAAIKKLTEQHSDAGE